MANTCVVVADGARARLFKVGSRDGGGLQLVEVADLVNSEYQARGARVLPTVRSTRNTSRQSGPMHPYEQKRGRHRLELERRFAVEVAAQTARLVRAWSRGSVLLVAEPRMLGFTRDLLRAALSSGIAVTDLARDYTHLTPSALFRRLGRRLTSDKDG